MPRINCYAIYRDEERLLRDYNEGRMTLPEYNRAVNDLHREAREEFQEQQRDEYRDEFGW